jgi:hypothetical protein
MTNCTEAKKDKKEKEQSESEEEEDQDEAFIDDWSRNQAAMKIQKVHWALVVVFGC